MLHQATNCIFLPKNRDCLFKITMSLAVTHSSKTEFTRKKWGIRSQAKLKVRGRRGGKREAKNKNISSNIYILLQTESVCPGNSDIDVTSLHNCSAVKTPKALEPEL
ncbi:hypothetical protein ACB098_10G094900 [Castanea mollissima]